MGLILFLLECIHHVSTCPLVLFLLHFIGSSPLPFLFHAMHLPHFLYSTKYSYLPTIKINPFPLILASPHPSPRPSSPSLQLPHHHAQYSPFNVGPSGNETLPLASSDVGVQYFFSIALAASLPLILTARRLLSMKAMLSTVSCLLCVCVCWCVGRISKRRIVWLGCLRFDFDG